MTMLTWQIRFLLITLTLQDPNILAKELVAKNAFIEMDADQDGVVSLEEFLAACLGQSELCQLLAIKAIEIFADWSIEANCVNFNISRCLIKCVKAIIILFAHLSKIVNVHIIYCLMSLYWMICRYATKHQTQWYTNNKNNIYKTKVVIKNEAIVRGIMKYVAEAKRDKTLNSVARHYCYHMSEIQPH